MLADRGVAVDHTTMYRWIQHFAPELEKRMPARRWLRHRWPGGPGGAGEGSRRIGSPDRWHRGPPSSGPRLRRAAWGRYPGAAGRALGRPMKPYLESTAEFFDRAAVPPQIQELLDEWPGIDPGTARLVRAAVMSRDPRLLRQAWALLYARAELARAVR